MLGIHACNGMRQRSTDFCVTDRPKLDPAMQKTTDRTDHFAGLLLAAIAGFITTASTGSFHAGVAVGTTFFLLYLVATHNERKRANQLI